jgi:hypothetical protein
MPLNQNNVEIWLSRPRFNRYLQRCGGDLTAATAYYEANVIVSQCIYNSLEALEVGLRNKIHLTLAAHFNKQNWYDDLLADEKYAGLQPKVSEAKEKLRIRKEEVIPGKMIAEFMLGFWVQMFNTEYQMELWKPLRNVFPNLPRENKQRHTVSQSLNKVRKLRNRIFHYEPVFWKPAALIVNYENIQTVLGWMDKDLQQWASARFNVKEVVNHHIQRLSELNVKVLND